MKSSAMLLSSSVASHTSTSRIILSIVLVLACNFGFSQRSALIDTNVVNIPVTVTEPLATVKVDLDKLSSLPPRFVFVKPQIQKKRSWIIGGVHAVGYGGSLILLNNAWYKGYERTSFHTFNDAKEWKQMDKIGHAWGAYNIGKVSSAMWEWTGMSHKKAVILGGTGSMAYLTAIEFLDAYSAKWGWSWSDIAANISGSGLFIAQELLWEEQRVQFKFSFHKKEYDGPLPGERADELFGKTWYERMLKDYNAQTYWFSANIRSFMPQSKWPAWLNIAVGYGADGMYGGFENKWIDELGNEIDRSDIPRKRQFYLAPDIDFTKIKTDKKWLRTVFTFLNAFKCPAPALMLDSKGKFRAYALYF